MFDPDLVPVWSQWLSPILTGEPVVTSPQFVLRVNSELAHDRRITLLRTADTDLVVVSPSFAEQLSLVQQPPADLDEVLSRMAAAGEKLDGSDRYFGLTTAATASLVEGLSFEQSYAYLDAWVIGALAQLGIQATYQPLNDIASPAGKIAGAAQKRLAGGAVLHHVTMAYDIDADKMLEVLRIGREKMSDKGTKSANKRVDPLRSQSGMPRAEVIEAFKNYFRSQYQVVDGEITAAERARAEELAATKFATTEWTARVP